MTTKTVYGYDDSNIAQNYYAWNQYRARWYTMRDIKIAWGNGYVYAFQYF